MKFQPQSEREIRDKMALPAGEYDFEVATAEEKTSQKGNDMIEVTLRVFANDGSVRLIRDWLLPSMELKLNRFCHATGLQEVYFAGELDAYACQGVSGRLKLEIQDSAEYGKQNRVKDYVVPSEESGEVDALPKKPEGVPAGQTKAARQAATERDAGKPYEEQDIPF